MASDGEEFYDDDGYYDDEVGSGDGEGMEEDDDDDEGQLSELEDSRTERPPECWAFKKESLSAAQQQDLSMVMNLFDIKQHHARALLIHHRWNMNRIQDQMDRKGQDCMLSEAGVVLPNSNATTAGSSSQLVTCRVCFDEFSKRVVSAMDCGHFFCNGCWTEYFVASLDGGKKQIRCMAVKCPAICDEAVVQGLLGRKHPRAADCFNGFLLQSYVDDNDAVKWCPSVPHCGHAIRVPAGVDYCEVECPCGCSFCFRCAAAAHSPCPCAMWERWERKSEGESENVRWLLANTKCCPKCHKPIVKEGGCNLVTCKCGQYLCWLCGGATGASHTWTSISGHSCNRFATEENKKVDNARRQVHRYEHFYGRFDAHAMSCKAERETLGPAIAKRVRKLEMEPFSVHLRDSSWLAAAYRALLRCRQVLARSYVFAYYMFDDDDVTPTRPPEAVAEELGTPCLSMAKRKELFEDFQEQLEKNVEALSNLLATDFTLLTEKEILQDKDVVRNLVKLVQKRCMEVYLCIQDDLLPMLVEPMAIAAYQLDGPSKAKEELLPA